MTLVEGDILYGVSRPHLLYRDPPPDLGDFHLTQHRRGFVPGLSRLLLLYNILCRHYYRVVISFVGIIPVSVIFICRHYSCR